MKKLMSQQRMLIGAALVLLMGGTANATLITIEPDDYAPGTDLSNVVPGVTLATLTQAYGSNTYNPTVTGVYASTGCLAYQCDEPTGNSMFAPTAASNGYAWSNSFYADGCHRITNSSGQSGYCVQGFRVLSATFDTATSFASFETTWTSDPVWIYAYNSAGQLVASCRGPNEANNPSCYTQTGYDPTRGRYFGTVSVSSAAADIAWLLAGSDNGVAGIDRMTFENMTSVPEATTSVPEPATFGMMVAGLLGGWVTRRRRRTS